MKLVVRNRITNDDRAQVERLLKWTVSFQHAAHRLINEHPEIRFEFPALIEALNAVKPDVDKVRERLTELLRRSE